MLHVARSPLDVRRVLTHMLALAVVGGAGSSMMPGAGGESVRPGAGVASRPVDDSERSMVFVERSVQATNLYNQRKFPEALGVFEELVQKYPDLDEDGYITLGLGDCLHAMGRDDQARGVYRSVTGRHIELKQAVDLRLRDIELAGPQVSDALIEELRRAVAATSGDDRVQVQLQLGRALQKRASALLKDAVTVFRTAAEKDRDLDNSGQRTISAQLVILAELQEDLATLVERAEKTWGAVRTLGEMIQFGSPDALRKETGIMDYRAEWKMDVPAGGQATVQAAWSDRAPGLRITVDGRVVKLDSTQMLLIQEHIGRIVGITKEGLRAEQAQPERPKP